MKKTAWIIVLKLMIISFSYAKNLSLSTILGSDSASKLIENGYYYDENYSPQHSLVISGLISERIQRYVNELNANFSLEFLYFVPNGQFEEPSFDQVLEALFDVESLTDAYMIRKNKKQSLFNNVVVFDNFENRQKITPTIDVAGVKLPISHHLDVSLKDSRLGKIDYRIEFFMNDQLTAMSMLNYSVASYMTRKIADKQKIRLSFFKEKVDGGFLYVAHIAAQIHDLDKAVQNIHLPSFFSRRLEGIKGWYFLQVYGVRVEQGIYPVAI